MRNVLISLLLVIYLGACGVKERTKNNSEDSTINEISENSASLAVKKEEQWWVERHQNILNRLKPETELILIGNSIFHSLDNKDRQWIWEDYLDRYHTVNMGISGDRTENVIWRLENGSLENINPKVAVILIGTNNTDGNHYLHVSTPSELAEGIKKICTIINKKLPGTKIILMGILPYGYTPNQRDNINKATNRIISKFPEENPLVHYADVGAVYLNDSGKIKQELMPDYLHPNAEGHGLMFMALEDKIAELMAE